MEHPAAILVVSYGTSQVSALPTLANLAREIGAAFPRLPLIHAFAHPRLRDALVRGGGPRVPLVSEALAQLTQDGARHLLIQPTYLLFAGEYQAMVAQLEPYAQRLDLSVGQPLLATPQDIEAVAEALPTCLPPLSPQEGALFLGHGASHEAHGVYAQLEQALHRLGHTRYFVGTLQDGPTPAETARRIREAGAVTRLHVHPLMVVCGVHATRDLLAGEQSWCEQLERLGVPVSAVSQGLGDCPAVRRLFVAHALEAAENEFFTQREK